jgi:hypothetical protein
MTFVIIAVIIAAAAALGATPSGFSWGRGGPRIWFRFGGRRRR